MLPLLQFAEDIVELEQAKRWTANVDAKYKALFGVGPRHARAVTFPSLWYMLSFPTVTEL